VYRGMKRIALAAIAALIVLPAAADAKAGIEFDSYPDTARIGQSLGFTVMAIDEQPVGGGNPHAIRGRRPLVTFRSESGRVLRVRTGATDSDGLARGRVAFPDRGPWSTKLRVGRQLAIGADRAGPIRVGVGLTQTIPSADAARPKTATPESGGRSWPWLLSLGAIGSAVLLLMLLMRRRGHWGAA
jgi:hypothetical protein